MFAHLPLILAALALIVAVCTLALLFVLNRRRRQKIKDLELRFDTHRRSNKAHGAQDDGWRAPRSSQPQRRVVGAGALGSSESNSHRASSQRRGQQPDGINNRLNKVWAELDDLGKQVHAITKRMEESDKNTATRHHTLSAGAASPEVHGPAVSSHPPHDSSSPNTRGHSPSPAEPPPLPAPEQAIVDAYDQAARGADRSAFTNRYQPERLDVANANELARDPSTSPRFEKAQSGEYLILNADLPDNLHAVVPKFGLTYTSDQHSRAAMSQVFRSEGFDGDLRYRNVRLIAPALFRNAGGSAYELAREGTLDLGPGE